MNLNHCKFIKLEEKTKVYYSVHHVLGTLLWTLFLVSQK